MLFGTRRDEGNGGLPLEVLEELLQALGMPAGVRVETGFGEGKGGDAKVVDFSAAMDEVVSARLLEGVKAEARFRVVESNNREIVRQTKAHCDEHNRAEERLRAQLDERDGQLQSARQSAEDYRKRTDRFNSLLGEVIQRLASGGPLTAQEVDLGVGNVLALGFQGPGFLPKAAPPASNPAPSGDQPQATAN